MKGRTILSSVFSLAVVFSNGASTAVFAGESESSLIDKVTAYTRVGDGQREVLRLEATVTDPSVLAGLSASDFDIVNNVSTIPLDKETGAFVDDYEDDGLKVSVVNGGTLQFEMTPFNYKGDQYSQTAGKWEVVCEKVPGLSFTSEDVDDVVTKTIDDVTIGEFTYAGLTRKYALYLPRSASGPTPLVVWNHGGGEYGISIEDTIVANRGITAWPEAGYETAVLMIQVSNPNYSYGAANDPARQSLIDQNNALQAALIRQLIAEGAVDENRVYVTGASSGGGATMRFLMQYPEMFAGAIACCSMDPIVSIHYQSGCRDDHETIVSKLEDAFQGDVFTWDETAQKMVTKKVDTKALLNVPVYFTHAENDPTCRSESSKAMYEAMNNLGDTNNNIVIWSDEEMKEAGIGNGMGNGLLHWSWVKVFNDNSEGSPMNWLFKQVKQPTAVFEDVAESSPYYDAIYWAADNGITTGKTATTFLPDAGCTRAQFVTFLWRMNGEPEPEKTAEFTDMVDSSSPFYKAISWAVEQGITTGYKDSSFRPSETCSRGSALTFIYRAAGEPEVGEANVTFSDMVPADHAYYKGIVWAAANNVTTGYKDGTFKPFHTCSRGQNVTFLYRAKDFLN